MRVIKYFFFLYFLFFLFFSKKISFVFFILFFLFPFSFFPLFFPLKQPRQYHAEPTKNLGDGCLHRSKTRDPLL